MSLEEIIIDSATVPNGELYIEKMGMGKPLILIHAGFSDRRDWMHQINAFGEKYQTITYDQRGSGNSSTVTTAFSPADDLKAVIEHLKLEKVILVGHSIGGTIALDFALQYPDKVLGLVLVASGVNGYQWSKNYLDWMQSIWSTLQPEKMTELFLSAPFYALGMQESSIKSEIETITKENFDKVLTWKTFDVRDVHWFFPEAHTKLKNLKVPTFVVYGDKDSKDIQKIASILSQNIKNVKTNVIRGSDHLLNFEMPDKLNKLILEFLSNLNHELASKSKSLT